MPHQPSRADGARVLADLNALRAIGAYKTGVHKPTFSEPHIALAAHGWRNAFPTPGLPARSTASATCWAPARSPGRNCWRARIWKARITRAGSMDRSASSMRWKPPACINRDPDYRTARSRSPHGATRKAISDSFLGSRSYVGDVTDADIDAARDRNNDRSMREALRDAGLAGRARARLRTRPAYRVSRGPYRTGRDARKQRPQDRRRHLHRRDLAIPHHVHRRTEPRRHHADGDPQGRRPGAGQILRRHRRALSGGLRAAHGVDHRPHHARSRRTQHHPGRRRNAVPDPRRRSGRDCAAGGSAARHGGGGRQTRPLQRRRRAHPHRRAGADG